MSSAQGNKFANYRYNPISGIEVPETITAENCQCAELTPELTGVYGFELLECPQSSPPGIISVTRNSDSQVFSYTSGNPGANQYFIDYTNNSPVIILPASQSGNMFTVSYYAIGAPDSVRNSRLIEESTRGIIGLIRAQRATSSTISADTTKTLSAKHATVYNLTIDAGKTLTVDQALKGQGVLHVYGDLTVNGTLSLKRNTLIVYGNILGTGTINAGPQAANGGDGGNVGNPQDGYNAITEYGGTGSAKGTGNGGGGGGGGSLGTGNGLGGNDGGNPGHDGLLGGGGGGGGATSGSPGAGGAAVPYQISAGGAGAQGSTSDGFKGGAGGGAGGSHLNIICFGTIAATLTFRTGLPGYGGLEYGTTSPGTGGTAGDLNLWSQYGSAPCTVQVNKVATYGTNRDGSNGTANYFSLDISKMFGILNDITKNPEQNINHADQIGYLFWTKQGTDF